MEWHQGELFPRIGFIVTNLSYPAIGIVRFCNGCCRMEQRIKEGKYTLNWTRLSGHKFVANQVRLAFFVLAYNLGDFMKMLAFPEMKHWSLTSLQTGMIKTGGRWVRHARRLVFQLAELLVSWEMLGGILERIGRLRLARGYPSLGASGLVTVKGWSRVKGLSKGETWAKTSRFGLLRLAVQWLPYKSGGFERIRPHLTSLGFMIKVQGNPEGAISRKAGLIWEMSAYTPRYPKGLLIMSDELQSEHQKIANFDVSTGRCGRWSA